MTLLEQIRRDVSLTVHEGPDGNKGCTPERADQLINEMTNVELLERISGHMELHATALNALLDLIHMAPVGHTSPALSKRVREAMKPFRPVHVPEQPPGIRGPFAKSIERRTHSSLRVTEGCRVRHSPAYLASFGAHNSKMPPQDKRGTALRMSRGGAWVVQWDGYDSEHYIAPQYLEAYDPELDR